MRQKSGTLDTTWRICRGLSKYNLLNTKQSNITSQKFTYKALIVAAKSYYSRPSVSADVGLGDLLPFTVRCDSLGGVGESVLSTRGTSDFEDSGEGGELDDDLDDDLAMFRYFGLNFAVVVYGERSGRDFDGVEGC